MSTKVINNNNFILISIYYKILFRHARLHSERDSIDHIAYVDLYTRIDLYTHTDLYMRIDIYTCIDLYMRIDLYTHIDLYTCIDL